MFKPAIGYVGRAQYKVLEICESSDSLKSRVGNVSARQTEAAQLPQAADGSDAFIADLRKAEVQRAKACRLPDILQGMIGNIRFHQCEFLQSTQLGDARQSMPGDSRRRKL